jgi:hypothetical protein
VIPFGSVGWPRPGIPPVACSSFGRRGLCGRGVRVRLPTLHPVHHRPVQIAGVSVERLSVLELAERLFRRGHDHIALLLRVAEAVQAGQLELTIEESEAIIDVLGVADDLTELYESLMVERLSRSLGPIA